MVKCSHFQCSSASRKFLNPSKFAGSTASASLSVLFSEPKIPQFCVGVPARLAGTFQCSSASRKFLNRRARRCNRHHPYVFQCSSASRKFLNRAKILHAGIFGELSVLFSEPKIPQSLRVRGGGRSAGTFSALQRAENSSIHNGNGRERPQLNFQCSSASRKFLNLCTSSPASRLLRLSVLFSEPKIPQ